MNKQDTSSHGETSIKIQAKNDMPENYQYHNRIYYVDGKFVPWDKAVIPVDDLAVLRGFGVCDLMRTYKGVPYFLREHVERLIHSAKEVDLKLHWSGDEIEQIILETLKQNPSVDEANIRVVITAGSSSDFLTPMGYSRLLVLITPIPSIPAQWHEKGVKVITVPFQRDVPRAKSLSYIPATLALKQAAKVNAVEALYVDPRGFVTEGTTSNLFAFMDNTLITAEDHVLKGITRKVILSLSRNIFKIKLQTLHLNELLRADEVFISGTNKGIVPVVQIDETMIGSGTPGENTRKIIKTLEKHTSCFKKDAHDFK